MAFRNHGRKRNARPIRIWGKMKGVIGAYFARLLSASVPPRLIIRASGLSTANCWAVAANCRVPRAHSVPECGRRTLAERRSQWHTQNLSPVNRVATHQYWSNHDSNASNAGERGVRGGRTPAPRENWGNSPRNPRKPTFLGVPAKRFLGRSLSTLHLEKNLPRLCYYPAGGPAGADGFFGCSRVSGTYGCAAAADERRGAVRRFISPRDFSTGCPEKMLRPRTRIRWERVG
jgi:hypothetical protein